MIIENAFDLDEFIINKQQDFYLYFLWFDKELVYIGFTSSLKVRYKNHDFDKLFDKVTYKLYSNISEKEIKRIERINIDFYKPIFNDNSKAIFFKDDYCFMRGEGTFRKGEFVRRDYSTKASCYFYYIDNILNKAVLGDPEIKIYKNNKLVAKANNEDSYRVKIVNKEITFLNRNEEITNRLV